MKYAKISVFIPNVENIPFFLGSQLRGAFGYGLKKVVCINPSFKCDGCFAKNNCIYYDFYEDKNKFHKYRFDFELAPKKYKYNLYLFNEATKELPYIISAIHQTITKFGFGKDRKKYDFFTIKVNDKIAYDGEEFDIPKDYVKEFINTDYSKNLTIELKTPLRMKRDGVFIKNDIKLVDIINSIYQRERALNGLEEHIQLPFKPQGNIITTLKLQKLTRYSNRQQTKMQIDGMIGKIEVNGIDERSYRYLKLGEIIGVGKLTTFGLGKIEMIDKI